MKTPPILALIATFLINTVFASDAKAAIVILFGQVGNDVVATTTGSIPVPDWLPHGNSP